MAWTETDWGSRRGCSRALVGLTVAAAVTVGLAGTAYDLHFLHWYFSAAGSAAMVVPSWTGRPLLMLLPARPAPTTPQEREHRVHIRIDRDATDTWLTAPEVRDAIEALRLLLADLDERDGPVMPRPLLTEPQAAAEEERVAGEWAAAVAANHPVPDTLPPRLPVTSGDADDVLRAAGFPSDDDQPDGGV